MDSVGADIVSSCLPVNASSIVLPVRGEAAFVNLRILFFIGRFSWRFLSGRVSFLTLYIAAVARALEGAVLLTFIDNSVWQKGLTELSGTRIIFVQNGMRAREDLQSQVYDIFFAFGEYCRPQIQANEFYPVGSVKLGMATEKYAASEDAGEHVDVLLVSQLRLWDENKLFLSEFAAAHELLLGWLAQLTRRKGLRLGIAFNSFTPDALRQEKAFVDACCDVAYAPFYRAEDIMGCYKGLLHSRLVMALGSTMLLEALGAGKRILIPCCVLEEPARSHVSGWFPESEFSDFLLSAPTPSAFETDVERLLAMGSQDCETSTTALRKTYCNFDRQALPQVLITHRIKDILNGSNNESSLVEQYSR